MSTTIIITPTTPTKGEGLAARQTNKLKSLAYHLLLWWCWSINLGSSSTGPSGSHHLFRNYLSSIGGELTKTSQSYHRCLCSSRRCLLVITITTTRITT